MSYVRYNRHSSDVYSYYDGSGYITHVANRRIVADIPWPPKYPFDLFAGTVPLRNKFADATFVDRSEEELWNRLKMLKSAGLKVPRIVLKRLKKSFLENRHEREQNPESEA